MSLPPNLPGFKGLHGLSPVILAAGLLAGAASRAPGAIQFVSYAASPVAIPNTIDGLYLNLATGAFTTSAVPVSGWDLSVYNGGGGLTFYTPSSPAGQGVLASGAAAVALTGGELISPGGLYQAGMTAGTGFRTAGSHYAGLTFFNEATATLNHGWVLISHSAGTGANAGFPASLVAYAYEDTGAPLTAGAIPEPSAVALLLLPGAALLTGGRSRRRSSGQRFSFP